jgi:outer membrane lipase/esterase
MEMFKISKSAILKKLKSSTAAIGLLAIGISGQSASAEDYTKTFVFGDSLSDVGNLFKVTGGSTPPAPYFKGRFSNGLVWAEIFAKNMKGITNNPGAVNLNIAFGGAVSGVAASPPSFLAQINILQGAIAQGGTKPIQGTDLVSVWIGANDYLALLAAPSGSGAAGTSGHSQARDVPAPIAAVVAQVNGNTAAGINMLHGMGARNFLVFNLPDLGKTPRTNGTPAASAGATLITNAHNAALYQTISGLKSSMSDSNFIFVDMASLLDHMIANAGDFGFTNVTDACLTSAACVTANQSTQNGFLFFDDIHPTNRAHSIIAQAVTALTNTDLNLQEISSMSETGLAGAKNMSRLISSHMSTSKAEGFTLSALGSYTFGDRDQKFGRSSYDYSSYAFGIAADYASDDYLIGLSFLKNNSDTKQVSGGSYDQKTWQVAGYAQGEFDGIEADAQIAYGKTDYENIRRHTGVGPIMTTAMTKGSHFTAGFTVGYHFKSDKMGSVKPFAGFRYISAKVDGYQETGGVIFNLDVSNQEVKSKVGILGLKFAGQFESGDFSIKPRAFIAHEHEFGGSRMITASIMGNTAKAATVEDTLLKDGLLVVGVGVDLSLNETFTASFDYVSELGIEGGRQNQFMLKLRASF